MNLHEIDQRQRYECESSDAVTLPKGAIGKTKGQLIGCFVPIICYDTELVFGHFGPRHAEKARENLSMLKKPTTPNYVYLYRNELTDESFWIQRSNEYIELFRQMRTVVAKVAQVNPEFIRIRKYPIISDVIIDWTQTDTPQIYTQPTIQSF